MSLEIDSLLNASEIDPAGKKHFLELPACWSLVREAVLLAIEYRRAISEKCIWSESNNYDDDYWDSGCGNAFTFIDGTPEENGMKFCPYCGKVVEIVRRESEGQ
jgi:hypothetical protein